MPRVSAEYLIERRDHVLAAAAVRFAREGFHRTSMQDVIDEAGLSPGAVYRYFRSKDEIIIAIATDAMGLVEGVVREALVEQRPLAELVGALPSAFLVREQADERMRLAVQAWGEALRNPPLFDAMQDGLNGVRGALAERVRAAQRVGDAQADVEADAVADVLLAQVQGFILQRCWNPGLDAAAYGLAARAVVAGALGPVSSRRLGENAGVNRPLDEVAAWADRPGH